VAKKIPEPHISPDLIKVLRGELKLSQQGFADAVGVATFVSVNRWEKGLTIPRARNRRAMRLLAERLESYRANAAKEAADDATVQDEPERSGGPAPPADGGPSGGGRPGSGGYDLSSPSPQVKYYLPGERIWGGNLDR
jgi:DNA-binding XRE family transcriptional regulator